MNEDFSFVRFLKVVKTLYESSTFTQLGKTVGSALGPLSSPMDKSESARAKEKDDILESDQVMTDALQRSGSTIFDALARACTSPHHSRREVSPKSTFAEDEKKDELSPHSGETLFERVINCTLIGGNDDEYSDDEDTLKTRTYDYQSYGESFTDPGESFESVTDDDESRRRSSRRSRRRRR